MALSTTLTQCAREAEDEKADVVEKVRAQIGLFNGKIRRHL